jgi:hypothetical protein
MATNTEVSRFTSFPDDAALADAGRIRIVLIRQVVVS